MKRPLRLAPLEKRPGPHHPEKFQEPTLLLFSGRLFDNLAGPSAVLRPDGILNLSLVDPQLMPGPVLGLVLDLSLQLGHGPRCRTSTSALPGGLLTAAVAFTAATGTTGTFTTASTTASTTAAALTGQRGSCHGRHQQGNTQPGKNTFPHVFSPLLFKN